MLRPKTQSGCAALLLLTAGFASPAAAINYTLDQPTCETLLSGTWTAASSSCQVTDFFLAPADALLVDPGVELSVDGTSQNQGVLSVQGLLENHGNLANQGRLFIDGDGEFRNFQVFTNEVLATMTNLGDVHNLAATIVNRGDLVNAGVDALLLNTTSSAMIRNYGALFNTSDAMLRVAEGMLDNNGLIENEATVEIIDPAAVMRNVVGATFNNGKSALLRNQGQVINSTGSRINNEGGSLFNTNEVLNYDDATISNSLGGMLANFGIIRNGTAGVISNRANVYNNDRIHNYCNAELFNLTSGNIFNTPVGVLNNHSGTLVNQGAIFAPAINTPCANWP